MKTVYQLKNYFVTDFDNNTNIHSIRCKKCKSVFTFHSSWTIDPSHRWRMEEILRKHLKGCTKKKRKEMHIELDKIYEKYF